VICVYFQQENEAYLSQTENKISLKEYSAQLNRIDNIENPNYVAIVADFEIWYKNRQIGSIKPELKFYKIEKIQLADSASISHYFSDIYLVISRLSEDKNKILVKIYYKPFVRLIWLSGIILSFTMFWGVTKRLIMPRKKKF
jgi:cytochrome c-type biogenesis protein CcmF